MQILNLKQAKHIITAIVGFTILLIGAAMLILPGPGIVVIIAGLMILAGQYLWARRLLKKVKLEVKNTHKAIRSTIYSLLA